MVRQLLAEVANSTPQSSWHKVGPTDGNLLVNNNDEKPSEALSSAEITNATRVLIVTCGPVAIHCCFYGMMEN